MRKNFLVFGAPLIEAPEIDEIVATMNSGWLGTGPRVARFEQDFAAFKGVKHVAAVNSGTAALHLSMLVAGLQAGDEVIAPAMTFCATINAIIHTGATPVLADIDDQTMNIDPARIEEKITSKTRAILPVHFAGRPCDMDSLGALARKHKLKIIEDCAHAIEAEYKGEKTGTLGDFGCFSFYVTKNICTGEGGMVIARSEKDISRIKIMALHGMSKDAWQRFDDKGYKHYYVFDCGYKYNMMDLQAGIGIQQLKRIEPYWHRRRSIWQRYNEGLAGLPIGLPAEPAPDTRHAYHLYTIMVDEEKCGISRDAFLEAMTARNIGIGVHYLSIPEHPFYQQTFGWQPEDYTNAMQIGRQTVSIPLSAKLTDMDVTDVITAVRKILLEV
jgi:dTDP-4-amino-4,6-dideoxygalactose transaminase